MTSGVLSKISAKSAAEICQRFELSDEGKTLLKPSITPREFLDLLAQAKQFPDAVRLLAFGMPKREAIWWAWSCAQRVADSGAAPGIAGALRAVEAWIKQQSESNRRAAKTASDAAGLSTPGGCAALAVFLSGGSLGPAE